MITMEQHDAILQVAKLLTGNKISVEEGVALLKGIVQRPPEPIDYWKHVRHPEWMPVQT